MDITQIKIPKTAKKYNGEKIKYKEIIVYYPVSSFIKPGIHNYAYKTYRSKDGFNATKIHAKINGMCSRVNKFSFMAKKQLRTKYVKYYKNKFFITVEVI